VDVEVPDPPAGFLRVRVEACALGLPDYLMCGGSYLLTPKLPFTPGQELSGVVTAVGEGAQARVGDSVMGVSAFFLGHGGFAEEALALDDFSFAVPAELAFVEAAAFVIPFHTAYVGLVRRAGLQAGETLLVLGGAGGTGSAAIQLGCVLGARVIATASNRDKADFCRELGADLVILHRQEPIAEAVRKATEGRGAEVIYDPVGGSAFDAATRCIAHEGRLLAVGFASGSWGAPDPAHMTTRNYSVMGVMPGSYDREFRLGAQAELEAHLASGALRVPVGPIHEFGELSAALEELGAGRVHGKSVLRGPGR
jgi:NADPH2:quinone reductase